MKILTLTPRQRIIYTPGLISLLLLPVFCMVFLHQHKAFQKLKAMDVVFFSPDWNKRLPKAYQFKFPPERSYVNVNLTGNTNSDQSLLEFARIQIRTILKTKNKSVGVQIHFGKKAQYWAFVKALDICYAEDVQSYAPYQDDIYVVYSGR
ncbi:hypothetical protein [Mucilaginibacter celer]|uniref:Uncharacterized protein n=1 Tax=Mucilaginibacter celer TaxID=2305508 RepID=A0A494VJN3_9SPHI|nr:hypothetical protein [Mucilaginibacter celer]AYL94049.1 hypothetical protein HYN43_001500 [Mucilaginibacter celer]